MDLDRKRPADGHWKGTVDAEGYASKEPVNAP
jgi:hypothetical protein